MRWILPFALTSALLVNTPCHGRAQPQFTLRVAFNERYSDEAGRAVDEAVHRYDARATVLLQPMYPPIVVATFRHKDGSACSGLIAELRPRPDVASIDCGPPTGT